MKTEEGDKFNKVLVNYVWLNVEKCTKVGLCMKSLTVLGPWFDDNNFSPEH